METLITENNNLKNEINTLKEELNTIKEKLKKYTSPNRNKKYYENHKEELLEKSKQYKVTPEKKKEYNQRYIQNKKEKLNNILEKPT